jgi:hypothetical protein
MGDVWETTKNICQMNTNSKEFRYRQDHEIFIWKSSQANTFPNPHAAKKWRIVCMSEEWVQCIRTFLSMHYIKHGTRCFQFFSANKYEAELLHHKKI